MVSLSLAMAAPVSEVCGVDDAGGVGFMVSALRVFPRGVVSVAR